MKILAFGVQAEEKPLLEAVFQGENTIQCMDMLLTKDSVPLADGYEVISTSVDADLTEPVLKRLAAGRTRMIAQRSIGFNHIDLETASRLGIRIARVPSYSPYSVAEFAWTLAMAVNRKVVRSASRSKEFDFSLDRLLGLDMHGRTAAVVGTGQIGAIFARIAKGFGMNLIGWDIRQNPECLDLGMEYVEQDELFERADLISLHVPLLDSTRHLVNHDALKRMKDTAILVNTSRGGIIDTQALIEELREGRFNVGLDVYEEESGIFHLPESLAGIADDTLARLVSFPNVIVTPHQAYYTADALNDIANTTAQNVADYLSGNENTNVLVYRHPREEHRAV